MVVGSPASGCASCTLKWSTHRAAAAAVLLVVAIKVHVQQWHIVWALPQKRERERHALGYNIRARVRLSILIETPNRRTLILASVMPSKEKRTHARFFSLSLALARQKPTAGSISSNALFIPGVRFANCRASCPDFGGFAETKPDESYREGERESHTPFAANVTCALCCSPTLKLFVKNLLTFMARSEFCDCVFTFNGPTKWRKLHRPTFVFFRYIFVLQRSSVYVYTLLFTLLGRFYICISLSMIAVAKMHWNYKLCFFKNQHELIFFF